MIVGQEPAAAEAPWTKKSDDFALLVKANWQFAVDDLKQFRPFIFWTNAGIGHHRACITARFPVHSAVARSHFSGLASEANCERTFSYSGRVLSDLRKSMSSEQLAAHVVGHTGGCSRQRRFLPSTKTRRRPAAEEKGTETQRREAKKIPDLSGGRRAHSHSHVLAASHTWRCLCAG